METCYFCRKGILKDKKVIVDFRWGTKLVVIEEVPAKVCNECKDKMNKERTKTSSRKTTNPVNLV